MRLDIKRVSSVIATVKIAEDAKYSTKMLGEEIISLNVKSPIVIPVLLGDYIVWRSRNFYLNKLPIVRKISANNYEYSFVFEALWYDLSKVQFLNSGLSAHEFMGTATDYIDLIVLNMNRVYGGGAYTRGTVLSTAYKYLTFNGENCLAVLNILKEQFNAEYYFDGTQINLVSSIGTATGKTLSYGKGKGLYELDRGSLDASNIVTRLFVQGSEKNIPANYRNYSPRLIFANAGSNYIDQNIGTYGVIEGSLVLEDIYPHRDGTVTSVNSNVLIFTDSGMDFDLNSYLISGVDATVIFNTGDLAGFEFKILSYIHSTKVFTLKLNSDLKGYELPNSTLKPAVNNKYVITGITLPTSYVIAAESELTSRGTTELAKLSSPKVKYTLIPDPKYVESESLVFAIGDTYTLIDAELGVNNLVRILGITQDITDPRIYTIDLGDSIYVPLGAYLFNGDVRTRKELTWQRKDIDIVVLKAETAQNTANQKAAIYGTPVDNQIAVWTGAGTIEGTSALTFDGTSLYVNGNLGVNDISAISGNVIIGPTDGSTALCLRAGGVIAVIIDADNNLSFANATKGIIANMVSDYNSSSADIAHLIVPISDTYPFATNSPGVANYHSGLEFRHNISEYKTQILTGTTGSIPYLWIRNKTDGTWGNWYKSVLALNNTGEFGLADSRLSFWYNRNAGTYKFDATYNDYSGVIYSNVNLEIASTSTQGGNIFFRVHDGVDSIDCVAYLNINGLNVEAIQSITAYSTGFFGNGYKIIETGGESTLEVDNLKVRKTLKAFELEINEITSIGGSQLISVANGIPYAVNGTTFTFDTDNNTNPIQFAVGDYIRAQVWTGDGANAYTGLVTAVNQSATYGSANIVATTISGTPWANMKLVQIGNTTTASRQNLIYMTAADTNNPYLAGYTGVTDGVLSTHEKFRLGNLVGVTDPTFGALSGFGLYAENVYLTGSIKATAGLIGGFTITATELYAGSGATRVEMQAAGGFGQVQLLLQMPHLVSRRQGL